MKRKFLCIMGITLCVFLLAGCGKRAATEGTKKSNCSLVQNNIEFKCPAMKEIKDSGEGFFITNNSGNKYFLLFFIASIFSEISV